MILPFLPAGAHVVMRAHARCADQLHCFVHNILLHAFGVRASISLSCEGADELHDWAKGCEAARRVYRMLMDNGS